VLHVSPTLATATTKLTLRGSRFTPQRRVTVFFGLVSSVKGRLLTTRASVRGTFVRSFRLGPTWSPGRYVFYACQATCKAKAYAYIRLR
jgi:hypothetical protein